MGSNPVFPVDLEREIFETAALSNPKTIPTLLLVARRVLIWIEPLLYRVIDTTEAETATALCLAMATKPASFFENHVRHILLCHTSAWKEEDSYALLRLCIRIESLAYGAIGDCSPVLQILMNMSHLRRWSGYLDYVFGTREAIDLRASFFRTVTHLDIFDVLDNDSTDNMCICADLATLPATLPALTNLCLNEYAEPTIVGRLLEECPVLRVLVNSWFGSRGRGQAVARNPGTVDPRFVVVLLPVNTHWKDDWQRGVRGGVDFWVAAESFVAQKRRGEIEASCCLLNEQWWKEDQAPIPPAL